MIRTLHPLALYGVALAATLSAYGIYAALVVPALEGQGVDLGLQRTATLSTTTPQEVSPNQDYMRFLPADGWEHKPFKRLEMDDGIVLFQDYKQREDGVVEVFPFTLILKNNQPVYGEQPKTEETPIIVRASKHAELKFDRPFVMGTASAGKLAECLLQGDVNVFRKATANDDGFDFWTRNVQLTPKRVVSLDEVRFQIGPHSGIGRHLILDLEHKTSASAINNSFSTVKGISRLELAFVERIRIIHEPKLQSGAKKSTTGTSLSTAPIDVVCTGPFVVDFTNQVAEFRDNVEITRLDAHRDQLFAERLRLYFTPDQSSITAANEQPDLKLSRIQLQGIPARLLLPSESAEVTGEILEYDLVKNEILGNDPRRVEIKHVNKQFLAQKIRYSLREDGGLGTLIAEGAGELHQTPTSANSQDGFDLQWSNFLTTEDVKGRKLITIAGDVSAQINLLTNVSGDKLELWLDEKSIMIPATESQPAKTKLEYLPRELLVDNNVKIRSPELDGSTRLLKLIWPVEAIQRVSISPAQYNRSVVSPEKQIHFDQRVQRIPFEAADPFPTHPQELGTLRPASELPVAPASQVLPATQPIQEAPLPNRNPRKQKLAVSGDIITVHLADNSQQNPAGSAKLAAEQFKKVNIDGRVVVLQLQAQDPTKHDLKITGDKLELSPQAEELFEASVLGNASVETPQFTMQGRDLHIDQLANRIWVSGAGSLVVRELRRSPDRVNEPAAAENLPVGDQPIHVEWLAGMIFDGEKIYFEQDVRCRTRQRPNADGINSLLRSQSEGLSLQLNRRIDLSQLDADNPATEEISVTQIVLSNQIPDRAFPPQAGTTTPQNVVLEKSNFDRNKEQVEKQLIVVPQVSMNTVTGDIRASGPGILVGWRKPKDGKAAGPKFDLASSSSGAETSKHPIQYLQANFDQRLVANTEDERIALSGNVRALNGGVNNWNQQLDPDLARIPADATRIKCDQLEVARWQPRGQEKPTSEIAAVGNVRVEGEQFEATAHRLTFDEASDFLTIEGDERTAATLLQKRSRNAAANQLSAGKIRYRPSDEEIIIGDVKHAAVRDATPGK
ncbi:MAG: hypothetical protein ABL888_01050 [Pirellulaceae bacterium]